MALWVGDKGREIYTIWTGMTNDEKKKLEPHYKRYLAHVQPKLNPISECFKFNNENQGALTVEQFVTSLRVLAEDCNYVNSKDEMIRGRIVFGTSSQKVREKLIAEGEKLTVEKAIQIAQSHEYSQEQLKTMSGQEIHAVSHSHNRTLGRQVEAAHLKTRPKIQSDKDPRRPDQSTTTRRRHKSATGVGMIILQVLNALRRVNSVRLIIDGTILLRNVLVKLLHVMNYRPCKSNQIQNQNFS